MPPTAPVDGGSPPGRRGPTGRRGRAAARPGDRPDDERVHDGADADRSARQPPRAEGDDLHCGRRRRGPPRGPQGRTALHSAGNGATGPHGGALRQGPRGRGGDPAPLTACSSRPGRRGGGPQHAAFGTGESRRGGGPDQPSWRRSCSSTASVCRSPCPGTGSAGPCRASLQPRPALPRPAGPKTVPRLAAASARPSTAGRTPWGPDVPVVPRRLRCRTCRRPPAPGRPPRVVGGGRAPESRPQSMLGPLWRRGWAGVFPAWTPESWTSCGSLRRPSAGITSGSVRRDSWLRVPSP